MKPVHYIIPTAAIGGAEKRFIELWAYLRENQQQYNLKLVISAALLQAIRANETLHKMVSPHLTHISVYDISFDEPVISFQKKLYRFVCVHVPENDIVHFILSFPTYIFPVKHKKSVYSLTESSLGNVNFKGRLLYLLNIFRARQADIIDPAVYRKLCKYFFYKKHRIHCTPGSFTDTSVFKPVQYGNKENWFVFLGRFFYVKQSVRLLETLPHVCQKLHDAGITGYKFIFLGYGQQETEMQQILQTEAFRNLPVEMHMAHDPETILAKSKVIFSVQLRNNYPSKSLLEGMSAGNIPLVTDVGTTRLMAAPDFSYYVPEQFTANDIAGGLISILSLDNIQVQQKMEAARTFVENNYSIRSSAAYYISLYSKFDC